MERGSGTSALSVARELLEHHIGPRNPNGGKIVGRGEGEVTPLYAEIPPAVLVAGFTPPGNIRMEPEIIIGALAIFVSGGAMGAAGMLLCQWVVGRMSPPPQGRVRAGASRDIEAMGADVADLSVRLHSIDARLDFTEQLLGGALSGSQPPESLPPPQKEAAPGAGGFDGNVSSDGEDATGHQ